MRVVFAANPAASSSGTPSIIRKRLDYLLRLVKEYVATTGCAGTIALDAIS
jgi:hypothetical protein